VHVARPSALRVIPALVLAIVFAALSVADLIAVFAVHDAWRPFTKPLLMPALIGVVLLTSGRFDRVRSWLVMALLWSAAGDALLLSRSDTAFVEGTLAFALAHLSYIACFTLAGSGRGLVRRYPWVAIPYALGWIAATAIVAPHMGALALVAVPYSFLLTAMALVALNLVGRIPLRPAILAAAGAALFMSSDTNIAAARFVPALAPPHAEFIIMLMYLAAQVSIAAGIVSIQRSAARERAIGAGLERY
jgi:alkenylglycerophosphocholine/alkenylglycerophosphoethanolamine hydrolase